MTDEMSRNVGERLDELLSGFKAGLLSILSSGAPVEAELVLGVVIFDADCNQ